MSGSAQNDPNPSMLDQGKDALLKSTPDGLFTIDRELKAEKESTILASVLVYASSLAVFLVLLLFELRKETVEKDVQITRTIDGPSSDGYTCAGLKTNIDFQTYTSSRNYMSGFDDISAKFEYSSTAEACRSAVGDKPCTELYYYLERDALEKGENFVDSYPMVCTLNGVNLLEWGTYIPSSTYDIFFGEGALANDCTKFQNGDYYDCGDEIEEKYVQAWKNLTASSKCPGMVIDFVTGSRKFSQSLQMSVISASVGGDPQQPYLYVEEEGLNGISVFAPAFDLIPTT